MSQPHIGQAVIWIRDARGIRGPLRCMLYTLAAHLPAIQQSIGGLAAESGFSASTLNRMMTEASERQILVITSGKTVGGINAYAFNWPVLRAMGVRHPDAPPSVRLTHPLEGTLSQSDAPPQSERRTPLSQADARRDKRANEETIRDPTRTPATRPPDLNSVAHAWQATHPKPVARKQPGLASTNGRPPVLRKQPAAKRQGTAKGSTTPEPP